MIGLWIPLIGALAWWMTVPVEVASEPWPAPNPAGGWTGQRALVGRQPMPGRRWLVAGTGEPIDALPWHVAAALRDPSAYTYGELREMVTILDHRLEHDTADQLALSVMAFANYAAGPARMGHPIGAWFNQSLGRFRFGVPAYPPPAPVPW